MKNKLKKAGYKLTRARSAVIEVLESNPYKHLSAEEIHHMLSALKKPVSLASVYRTLNLLTMLRLLQGINLFESHAHYEIEHKWEIHLVCQRCARVLEDHLDNEYGLKESIEKLLSGHRFEMRNIGLEVYGICSDCRDKANK